MLVRQVYHKRPSREQLSEVLITHEFYIISKHSPILTSSHSTQAAFEEGPTGSTRACSSLQIPRSDAHHKLHFKSWKQLHKATQHQCILHCTQHSFTSLKATAAQTPSRTSPKRPANLTSKPPKMQPQLLGTADSETEQMNSSDLPLLRVPVMSLKMVWANLTIPCLHLFEQPLMI